MKPTLKLSALALAACLLVAGCSGGGAPNQNAPALSEAPRAEGALPSSPSQAAEAAGEAYDQAPAPAPERGEDRADFYTESEAQGETYLDIRQNPEQLTQEDSLLTFSLKVDTAAYSNVARYLESGNLPPADAVRTEELINYFSYQSPALLEDGPFSLYAEAAPSPFGQGKQMAFIRVKTREVDKSLLPRSNLVFLIDTSGSMDSFDKLPLLKEAFGLLVDTLGENDKVSIVTYAGSSAVVLDSVSGGDKARLRSAIQTLEAGGSTAGADGILTAYALAEKNLIQGGNNRVILATDGDFNVGPASPDDLTRLIQEKREGGVYLSLLGFGTGNLRDDAMETLATHGNGNYSYIRSVAEAKKVLVEELGSNLFTVADDVKAQIAFRPETVKSFRLIGYENRRMEHRDFEDDRKDAGEIGVGADVVVLVELELTDPTAPKGELMEVRIRYKNPGESASNLVTLPVSAAQISKNPSADWGWACSVAGFCQLLRNEGYAREGALAQVIALAENNLGTDPGGYRRDHLALLETYQRLTR